MKTMGMVVDQLVGVRVAYQQSSEPAVTMTTPCQNDIAGVILSQSAANRVESTGVK